jgi:hypothetical protein
MLDGSIRGASAASPTGSHNRLQFEEIEPSASNGSKITKADIAIMCIPVGGIIYQMVLESRVSTEIAAQNVNKGSEWNEMNVQRLIDNKNEIKKYALIALGVNAIAAACFMWLFPLIAAMVAAGYLCFMVKNVVQWNANEQLKQRIIEGSTVPPGGPNQEAPRDKTIFKAEDVE